MSNDIQYLFGKNSVGEIVKADDAQKGELYYCPECGNEFVLRKSGNTGKGSRRPHFAHSTLTETCKYDNYLHTTFITLAVEKIREHISCNKPMDIEWKCTQCGLNTHYKENMLAGMIDVKTEYDMTICRPDIALISNKNRVSAVIEVIVTHKPEERTLNFYKENDIIVIQIIVKTDNDIENIDYLLRHPTSVSLCKNPQCTYFVGYPPQQKQPQPKKRRIIKRNSRIF